MSQEPKLLLPHEVFVCLSGEYCVFLDLRHDAYWCLPRAVSGGLVGVVSGWPFCSEVEGDERLEDDADLDARLEELVAAGLLTTNSSDGKDSAAVAVRLPERTIDGERDEAFRRKPVGAKDVAGFFAAAGRAALQLRRGCIADTVHAVEHRKAKRSRPGEIVDFGTTAELLSRFMRLRPWFPRTYLCLFDSLALIEFLAGHGVFPTWAFGVRTEPFSAHCWVQQGDVLLNDSLDRVRAFTPIMAI